MILDVDMDAFYQVVRAQLDLLGTDRTSGKNLFVQLAE